MVKRLLSHVEEAAVLFAIQVGQVDVHSRKLPKIGDQASGFLCGQGKMPFVNGRCIQDVLTCFGAKHGLMRPQSLIQGVFWFINAFHENIIHLYIYI